jgi:high-affinity Fe2+/Pb2+ permease
MFFTAVFGDFRASTKHLFFVNILFDILLIALIIYIYEEIIKPFFVKKLKIKFLN